MLFISKHFLFSRYNNKIFFLYFSLSKLSHLQELDMSWNTLNTESISVFGDMKSLIKLNISLCGLGELPQM